MPIDFSNLPPIPGLRRQEDEEEEKKFEFGDLPPIPGMDRRQQETDISGERVTAGRGVRDFLSNLMPDINIDIDTETEQQQPTHVQRRQEIQDHEPEERETRDYSEFQQQGPRSISPRTESEERTEPTEFINRLKSDVGDIVDFYDVATINFLSGASGASQEEVLSGTRHDDMPEMDSETAQGIAEFTGQVGANLYHLGLAKAGLGGLSALTGAGQILSNLPNFAQAGARTGALWTARQGISDLITPEDRDAPEFAKIAQELPADEISSRISELREQREINPNVFTNQNIDEELEKMQMALQTRVNMEVHGVDPFEKDGLTDRATDYVQTFLTGFAGGSVGSVVGELARELAVQGKIPDSIFPLALGVSSGAAKGAGMTGVQYAFDPENTEMQDLGLNMATMAIWSTIPMLSPENYKAMASMPEYIKNTRKAISDYGMVEPQTFGELKFHKQQMEKLKTDAEKIIDIAEKKAGKPVFQQLSPEQQEAFKSTMQGMLSTFKMADDYVKYMPISQKIKIMASGNLKDIAENSISDLFSTVGIHDLTIDFDKYEPYSTNVDHKLLTDDITKTARRPEERPATQEANKLVNSYEIQSDPSGQIQLMPKRDIAGQIAPAPEGMADVVDDTPQAMPGYVDEPAIELPGETLEAEPEPALDPSVDQEPVPEDEQIGIMDDPYVEMGDIVTIQNTEFGTQESGMVTDIEEVDGDTKYTIIDEDGNSIVYRSSDPNEHILVDGTTREPAPAEQQSPEPEESVIEPTAETQEPTPADISEPVQEEDYVTIEPAQDLVNKNINDVMETINLKQNYTANDLNPGQIQELYNKISYDYGEMIKSTRRHSRGSEDFISPGTKKSLRKDYERVKVIAKEMGVDLELDEFAETFANNLSQDVASLELGNLPNTSDTSEPASEEPAPAPEETGAIKAETELADSPLPDPPGRDNLPSERYKEFVTNQALKQVRPSSGRDKEFYVYSDEPSPHFEMLFEGQDKFSRLKYLRTDLSPAAERLNFFRYKPSDLDSGDHPSLEENYEGRKNDWHAVEEKTGKVFATGKNLNELKENLRNYLKENFVGEFRETEEMLKQYLPEIGASPRYLDRDTEKDLFVSAAGVEDGPFKNMYSSVIPKEFFAENLADTTKAEEVPLIEKKINKATKIPKKNLKKGDYIMMRELGQDGEEIALVEGNFVNITSPADSGKEYLRFEDMNSTWELKPHLTYEFYKLSQSDIKELEQAEQPEPAAQTQPRSSETFKEKLITEGRQSRITTADDTSIDTHFAVVEADDLLTSHDTDMKVNPDFPEEAQPRDRGKRASLEQVDEIYRKLDPERLGDNPIAAHGSPIIGKDGVVEVGNARSIAIKKLYKDGHHNAEDYRGWLASVADEYGLDIEAIADAEKPVLVRVRDTEVPRNRFVVEANKESVGRMSAAEQGMVDAQIMPPGFLNNFNPGADGDINVLQNRDFITKFLDNIVGPSGRGEYLTAEGNLNLEGQKRIEAAVFMSAFPDMEVAQDLLENPDSNIRNITKGMMKAAGKIARIKEKITKGELPKLDISDRVTDSVKLYKQIKSQFDGNVQKYKNQTSFFHDEVSNFDILLAEIMDINKNSATRVGMILENYYELLDNTGINPKNISFDPEFVNPPSKEELLEKAYRKMKREGGYQESTVKADELFGKDKSQMQMFEEDITKEAKSSEKPSRGVSTNDRILGDLKGRELVDERQVVVEIMDDLKRQFASEGTRAEETVEFQTLKEQLEEVNKELSRRKHEKQTNPPPDEGYHELEENVWRSKNEEFQELLRVAEGVGLDADYKDYEIPTMLTNTQTIARKWNETLEELQNDIEKIISGDIVAKQTGEAQQVINDIADIPEKEYTNQDELKNSLAQLRLGNTTPVQVIWSYHLDEAVGGQYGTYDERMKLVQNILDGVNNYKDQIRIDLNGYGHFYIDNTIEQAAYLLDRLGLKTEFQNSKIVDVMEGEEYELNEVVNQNRYDLLEEWQNQIELKLNTLENLIWKKGKMNPQEDIPDYANPVTRQDIESYINNELGIPLIYGRVSNARAEATYNRVTKHINSRNFSKHEITAHEIGHHLSNILGIEVNEFDELIDIAETTGITDLYPSELWHEEGNAEFFVMYLLRPEQALDMAPKYYMHIESLLDENPELKEKVNHYRSMMDRWFSQTAKQRVADGQVALKDPEGEPLLTTKQWLSKRLFDTFETGREVLERSGYNPVGKYGNEDPEWLYRLLSKTNDISNNLIQKGLTDIDGNIIDDSLVTILDPVKEHIYANEKQGLGDFNAYAIIRHAIEREVRNYEKKIRQLIQADDDEAAELSAFLDEAIKTGDLDKQLALLQKLAERREDSEIIGAELQDMIEAAEFVIEKDNTHPEFKETLARLSEWKNKLLDWLVDSGTLTPESASSIKNAYAFHVPFHRFFGEGDDLVQSLGRGKNLVNLSDPIKKMYGSNRIIQDPVSSLLQDIRYIVNTSIKERFTGEFIKAVYDGEEDVPPGLITEVTGKKRPIEVTMGEIKQHLIDLGLDEESADQIFENISDEALTKWEVNHQLSTKDRKEFIVKANIDGETRLFQMHPDVYRFMTGLDELFEGAGGQNKAFKKITNTFKKGAVAAWRFPIANVVRDAFRAKFYKGAKAGWLFQEFITGLLNLGTGDFSREEINTMFKATGGTRSGWSYYLDEPDMTNKDTLDALLKGGFQPKKHLNPIHWTSKLTVASEDLTRKGLFIEYLQDNNFFTDYNDLTAKERGQLLTSAGRYAAGQVLEDYSIRGDLTKRADPYFPFLSSTMTSIRHGYQMHTGSMLGDERTMRDALLEMFAAGLKTVTLLSLGLYAWNRDKLEYQELPQSTKDYNFIFVTPEDNVIKFPKPFQIGLLYGTIPERFLEAVDTRDPEKIKDLWSSLLSFGAPTPVPAHIIPYLEWIHGTRIGYGDIIPQRDQDLDPQYQYGPYTSEIAKFIGKMNAGKLSPYEIDHLIRGQFVSLGDDFIQMTQAIAGEQSVIESMLRTTGRYMEGLESSSSLNRLYRERDRAANIVNTFEHETEVRRLKSEDLTYSYEEYGEAEAHLETYQEFLNLHSEVNNTLITLHQEYEYEEFDSRQEQREAREILNEMERELRENVIMGARSALQSTGVMNYPGY